jgi:hypothetical protein
LTHRSRNLATALRLLILFVVAPFLAAPAHAQDPYVGAALVGNIVRTSGLVDADGESLGWSLRVGTPLGDRWGVDAEFVYPGELESSSSLEPFLTRASFAPGLTLPTQLRESRSSRHSTLSASAWVRQRAGDRVELMYHGGVVFGLLERSLQVRYPELPAIPGLPALVLPNIDTSTRTYEVGPLVGIDARIRMTDHLRLVPGVRLMGFSGILITRPAVGLHWVF